MVTVQGISWFLVRVRDEHFSYGGSDDVVVAGPLGHYGGSYVHIDIRPGLGPVRAPPDVGTFCYLIILDDALAVSYMLF